MYKLPNKMPLQYKLMALTTLMVCFVLLVVGSMVIYDNVKYVEESIAFKALNIGRIIAKVPAVQRAIISDDPSAVLQPFAERWRVATGAAFIVISNMEEIRLSHPLPDKVGTPMADLYREPVLYGEEYVYVGKGSLAASLRANVPIFDLAYGHQIGFVSVGFYLDEINEVIIANAKRVLYALLLALSLSVVGAVFLARNVKKSIFGLEPHEIAMILKERLATLQSIREGVLAVDLDGQIRVCNREAAAILDVSEKELYGSPLRDVFFHQQLEEVLTSGQPIYDQQLSVGSIMVLANTVPIEVDGRVAGAVISFRDRTEVVRMAEELTGVHRLVDTLRAQSHEFKNKLHTVAGLIQLNRYGEAVDLITEANERNQELIAQLGSGIKDSVIFGLLVGKASRLQELGIVLTISPRTTLHALPAEFTSGDMVLVLGNLLENASEAVQGCSDRRIFLEMTENGAGVHILVRNTGPWIPAELEDSIYQRGVTTKGLNRGLGLSLVAEKLSECGGTICHCNLPEGGVEFAVFIPWQAR